MIRSSSAPYVVPFAVFILLLFLNVHLTVRQDVELALSVLLLCALTWFFSRHVIDLRVSRPLASVALGVVVFVLWIGPDLVWPQYRQHWLLQNSITGQVRSSLESATQQDWLALTFRTLRAAAVVPIIEELFWRVWLLRWMIRTDFHQVPLGTYQPLSFWGTALLFASEHGPYWDVGLIAGVAYNAWMIRSKSQGDCILAHAVTNACLSAYILATHKWEYWL